MSALRTKAAGIGALASLLVAAVLLPASASAATTTTTDPVAAAAGWLTTQFEDATHLPVPAGDHFDAYDSSFGYFAQQGTNADVIFGLAAAKAGSTKSATALAYLATSLDDYADITAQFGGPYDGSVAKVATAVIVAGGDPTAFGGHNLLQTLKDDECAPVSPATTCAVAGTPPTTRPAGSPASIFSSISASFVILAEARGAGVYAPSANALTYFLSLQCANGGFTSGTSACGPGTADIDATTYALMALQAVGGHATAVNNAKTWLTAQRNAAGYWPATGTANTNSTGLAAAALAGQGVDTSASKTWLLSQQVPAGSAGAGALKYTGAFTPTALKVGFSPSVLATAQGLTGLVAGGSLATLTATGSTATVSAFAPAAAAGTASVTVGAAQTATASGFAAGEQVAAVLNSTPVALGNVTAGADGSVALTFTVPATLDPGSHTVTFTGATSGLTATTAAFTAVAAPELANTGTNGRALVMLSGWALLALVVGTALTYAGRRRRTI